MQIVNLLVLFAVALVCQARAYPLYYSANGSVLLSSAHGGDIILKPDAGGTIVAQHAVLSAEAGLLLNGTLLTEALLLSLLSQLANMQQSLAALQPPSCTAPGSITSSGYPLLYCGLAVRVRGGMERRRLQRRNASPAAKPALEHRFACDALDGIGIHHRGGRSLWSPERGRRHSGPVWCKRLPVSHGSYASHLKRRARRWMAHVRFHQHGRR